jgi:hypothetical protein
MHGDEGTCSSPSILCVMPQHRRSQKSTSRVQQPMTNRKRARIGNAHASSTDNEPHTTVTTM